MFTITIPNRESKFLRRLSNELQSQVNEAIAQLGNDPRPSGCLKLTNAKDVWRVRVGHYRIGYTINEETKEITIVTIAHRNDFYPKGATH